MKRFGPCLALLFLAAGVTLACGSSQHSFQSISVTPATADARSYPDDQVPFTALGYYSSSSSPSPVNVTWEICGDPSDVAISSTGVAQCEQGASGTFVVAAAYTPPGTAHCNVAVACGYVGAVCGTIYAAAKLTCP